MELNIPGVREIIEFLKNIKEEDIIYKSIEEDNNQNIIAIHLFIKAEKDKKVITMRFEEGIKTADNIKK